MPRRGRGDLRGSAPRAIHHDVRSAVERTPIARSRLPRRRAAPARVTAAIRQAPAADLDPTTLYRILRLRQDVFVIEQDCPYLDLDGRDLEASTGHLCA